MKFRDKFPNLFNFLGAYFHQDFDLEYQNEEEAIKDLVDNVDPEGADIVIDQLGQLIALGLKEPELERVVCDDLGSGYYPDTDYKDMNDWLRFIRDTMAKYAAEKAKQEKAASAKSKQ